MGSWEKNLNALQAFIISGVLFGAFAVQFFEQEEPCPLCLLQRLGMIGVASGALMNCRFGSSRAHYGLSLLSAVFGGFVALRQIALHVCPGFPIFGRPFWGLSLYTWSFIVFASSVAYIALLLLIFSGVKRRQENPSMNGWGHLSFVLLFVASFANIVWTLFECGLGPCK